MPESKEVTVMINGSHAISFGILENTGSVFYHIRPYQHAQPQDQRTGVRKMPIAEVTLFDGFRSDLNDRWVNYTYAIHDHNTERIKARDAALATENERVEQRVGKVMDTWEREHPGPKLPEMPVETLVDGADPEAHEPQQMPSS